MTEDFPAEIWLRVFAHLLPNEEDVKNIALTSRSFQYLSQPLLFQRRVEFKICDSSLERITQRLKFLTLPRIAPYVRNIDIEADVDYDKVDQTVASSVIVDTIFRYLPLFSLLHTLRASKILFAPKHISTLSGLSSFESFSVVDCHVSTSLTINNEPLLTTKELIVHWRSTSVPIDVMLPSEAYSYWLSLFRPDILRRLRLSSRGCHLDQVFSNIATSRNVYSSLCYFSCPWYIVQSPVFFQVLAQFPSLVELRLPTIEFLHTVTFETPLPDHLLPKLRVLEVPDRAVHLFVQNRPIRELYLLITTFTWNYLGDIIPVLNQLSLAASGMESITLYVNVFTQRLCDALATRFAHLKSLTVLGYVFLERLHDSSISVETILASVLSHYLPPTLQYLHIGSKYGSRKDTWEVRVDADSEDILALKSLFIFNNPQLREVHFNLASVQVDLVDGKLTVAWNPASRNFYPSSERSCPALALLDIGRFQQRSM